jgi:hypothetical protein
MLLHVVSCIVAFVSIFATTHLAASSLTSAQHPTQAKPPAKARIQLGRCDLQVTYNLPAQRFDETAIAIARATGCFIRYTDKSLVNVPVKAVRGRLTRRQALRVALRGTSLRVVRETPDLMEVMRITTR